MDFKTKKINLNFQTSSLIVREMQKFICRQADDVALVLPLPLPNRRQSRLADKTGKSLWHKI